jgi:hypothetical protein
MSAPFDAARVPREPREPLCPRCGSRDIRGLGRVVATTTGVVWAEHRCQQCATTFWLYPDRRQGPSDRRGHREPLGSNVPSEESPP